LSPKPAAARGKAGAVPAFTQPTLEIVYDPEAAADAQPSTSAPRNHDHGPGGGNHKAKGGDDKKGGHKRVELKPGPKKGAKSSGKKPWWLLRREEWKAKGQSGKPKKQDHYKQGQRRY